MFPVCRSTQSDFIMSPLRITESNIAVTPLMYGADLSKKNSTRWSRWFWSFTIGHLNSLPAPQTTLRFSISLWRSSIDIQRVYSMHDMLNYKDFQPAPYGKPPRFPAPLRPFPVSTAAGIYDTEEDVATGLGLALHKANPALTKLPT
jgi:hypothetical protein